MADGAACSADVPTQGITRQCRSFVLFSNHVVHPSVPCSLLALSASSRPCPYSEVHTLNLRSDCLLYLLLLVRGVGMGRTGAP